MKILVPVDGSKHAKAALDFVASRTTLIGANPDVALLNVQLPVPPRAARMVGRQMVRAYHEEEANKVLKPAQALLKKAGLQASVRWVVGHPAEEIARAADRDRVDLIVMGSHGHGALAGLVMGSVAYGVLSRTTKPIVLLRARHAFAGDALSVGIAVDGSKYGRAAARYVLRHRDLFGAGARFVLLHVVPDYAAGVLPDMGGLALPALTAEEIRATQNKAFEEAVAPVRRLLAQGSLQAEEVCLVGNPGDEIAAYAKKKKLDLLVMGSHGWGALKRAVLGSVATRVAAHCDTPLLLVREA
ncbi:MAG: universal stress protein [Burkholderiaceae bacterium]|nr:universal stress protein [Burkholderiaceae bacterium]